MPLIGFFGCPSSGKTTVSAKLFSKYKESSTPCEFITESARTYIALTRIQRGSGWKFTDEDHEHILEDQIKLEEYYVENTNPSCILLTDGSVLNSFLYMSEPDWDVGVDLSLGHYDRIFVCDPIPPPIHDDLRIHTYEESLIVHQKVLEIEEKYRDILPFVHLSGNLMYRMQVAQMEILEAIQESYVN